MSPETKEPREGQAQPAPVDLAEVGAEALVAACEVATNAAEAHHRKTGKKTRAVLHLTIPGWPRGKRVHVQGKVKGEVVRRFKDPQGRKSTMVRIDVERILRDIVPELPTEMEVVMGQLERALKDGVKVVAAVIHHQLPPSPETAQALADKGVRLVLSRLVEPGRMVLMDEAGLTQARAEALNERQEPLEYVAPETESALQAIANDPEIHRDLVALHEAVAEASVVPEKLLNQGAPEETVRLAGQSDG